MFYFVYNVLIISIVFNHVICSISKSISSEDNVYGPTIFKRSTSVTSFIPSNNNTTTAITTVTNKNATIPNIRKRDSQLLSLLAARRRQIIQNRLQNNLTTTIANTDIIETTTHLNQLLSIISATTRAYVDIRALRHKENIRNVNNKDTITDNGGNKTTKYHNVATPTNNKTNIINGTIPNYPNTTFINSTINPIQNSSFPLNSNSSIHNKNVSKENVSQLAQNSSKLFQNTLYNLNNNSDIKKQNITRNKNSLLTQVSNAQKFIYKAQKSSKSILKDSFLNNNSNTVLINNGSNVYVPLQTTSRNKRLPIDIEQIAYETLGLAEKKTDEPILDLEDSLQVQESNHDNLYLLNFLQKSVNKTLNKTLDQKNEKLKNNNTLLMSESLYNHFRPLETNLPDDEIQPFLYFGQKLTSTSKPSTNRITKVSILRHQYRMQNPSFKNTDDSNLMDINVDRLNIANKVLNIRALPTRPSVGVREYFRTKSNQNNNTTKNVEYNVTRSNTNYKGPHNKTEPTNILNIQRKNNNDSVNISIKYDILNESESRETPHKYSPRNRHTYTRNPNNRTYFVMPKRSGASFRSNIPRNDYHNHSDLILSDSKSSPIANPLSVPLNYRYDSNLDTTVQTVSNESIVTTPKSPILTTQIVSTNVVTSVSIKTKTPNVTTIQPEPETTTNKFQIIVADVETTTEDVIEEIVPKHKLTPSTQKVFTSTFVLRPTTTTLPKITNVIKETTVANDENFPAFTSKIEIVTYTPKITIQPNRNITRTSINRNTEKVITVSTSTSTGPPLSEFNSSFGVQPVFFPNNSPVTENSSETIIMNPNKSSAINDNNILAYVLTILGVLPLILIIAFIIRTIIQQRLKQLDSEADILAESTQEKEKPSTINHVTRLPMIITDANLKWEFPRNKLRLKTLLGEGNFGQVWKAEADDLKDHDGLTRLVAVKTIKDGYTSKERDDLHRELFIMQKIGSHPNVVQLLGCCTDREPYLLIMEYVMYGKLLTYLRDHRTRRDYYNFSDDSATLTSKDLTVFAYCVARGMEYLTSKGIIHRDLAARNILVDHNKLCKISDFGLSRYSPTKEIKEPRQPKNPLPVRWMATEALMFSLFTEKSDVWSFGILLWEIVTLGATPYATMSGREVMHCVCDGYRLERPSHCKPEIYRVMARCWSSDPNSRPTFAELRNELAELLENNSMDYSYVDLESFAADSNVYEITNINNRGNYCTIQSRISEFECDI